MQRKYCKSLSGERVWGLDIYEEKDMMCWGVLCFCVRGEDGDELYKFKKYIYFIFY